MIITLIGSARFEPWFKTWNKALSLAGHCVFGLSSYPSENGGEKNWYSDTDKQMLDAVHKAKIDHSDAVLLLNVFGYIGQSTLSELAWCRVKGKQVHALESWGKGYGIDADHHEWLQRLYRVYVPELDFRGSPIDTAQFGAGHWHLLGPAGEQRYRLVQLVSGVARQEAATYGINTDQVPGN